jgi:(4S)-4-hydroxy-5-phosphonooxypentane-2,3-dione isomerase
MTGFAIIVEFRLKPGVRAEFRRLMDVNARLTAQSEPGCRRFDVVEPRGEPDRVMLYEIYDDEAAFEAHLKAAHFLDFDAASAPLVIDKTIIRGDLVCEGGASTAG